MCIRDPKTKSCELYYDLFVWGNDAFISVYIVVYPHSENHLQAINKPSPINISYINITFLLELVKLSRVALKVNKITKTILFCWQGYQCSDITKLHRPERKVMILKMENAFMLLCQKALIFVRSVTLVSRLFCCNIQFV